MNQNDQQNSSKTPSKINRRTFLRSGIIAGIITGAGALASSVPLVRQWISESNEPASPANENVSPLNQNADSAEYPFKIGVASGEPLPDGVVLWTRLVPDPRSKGGGMPNEAVSVQWEIAKDDKFHNIVKKGTEKAEPSFAHSVHVEVSGLEPATWYYYRFIYGTNVSPIGKTKTTPAANAKVDRFNFAFASCQSLHHGFFTAYDHMVKEDLDLVIFLGDYLYAGGSGPEAVAGRFHFPNKTLETLDDFRMRLAQYRSDSSLQAAHAAFPWLVTYDDNEFRNNWGGNRPPYSNDPNMLKMRAAFFQAFYEHMPLRKSSIPNGIDIEIYRRVKFGDLVEFSVLDTRQFRAGVVCKEGITANCSDRSDPGLVMLGEKQEKWLLDGLTSSSSRWNVLAQQVLFAQVDRGMEGAEEYNTDSWSGFVATRDRLQKHIVDHKINNFVVLTGDSHSNWVNDLLIDFNDKESAVWGSEFGVTSITSGKDGTASTSYNSKTIKENPHVKYRNGQRGYTVCQVTPNQWKSIYRVLSYVTRPNSPISTSATFVLQNGKPGVSRA